jgi:hypothetical protein
MKMFKIWTKSGLFSIIHVDSCWIETIAYACLGKKEKKKGYENNPPLLSGIRNFRKIIA